MALIERTFLSQALCTYATITVAAVVLHRSFYIPNIFEELIL